MRQGGSRPSAGSRQASPGGYRYGKSRSTEDFLVWFLVAAVALLIALVITFMIVKTTGGEPKSSAPAVSTPLQPPAASTPPSDKPVGPSDSISLPPWNEKPSNLKAFVPKTTSDTQFAADLNSEYAILVSLSDNSVIASKAADERMYPASMTKIMTVIVACENITDMWDTFTITTDIRYPLDSTGASMAYFAINQPIYLIDLIYGAWLPSGADATTALAVKIAGSEAAFVDMMNAKAAEIGCSNTHFTNTTGLHDQNHYSTVRDMATIMSYAVNNPLIKTVMRAKSYETHAKLEKQENKLYATWNNTLVNMSGSYSFFMGAKTGYEDAAGSCMASLIKDKNGNEYVTITGKATYSGSYSGRQNTFIDVKKMYDSFID